MAFMFLVAALVVFLSLWSSASIVYSMSKHYYLSALGVLPVILLYVGFLYAMSRTVRLLWIAKVMAAVVSLVVAVHKEMASPSQQTLWVIPAALGVFALLHAVLTRESNDLAEGPIGEGVDDGFYDRLSVRLFMFLLVAMHASTVLSGYLFALALVFGIDWPFIEGVEFVQEPLMSSL